MKKTWDGEAIKALYRKNLQLQGEWVDFTHWAREVYVDGRESSYPSLQVGVSDARMHQEIVTGILYAILVKRYKWSSIMAYYYPYVRAWISFCEAQPVPVYLESISQEMVEKFVSAAPNLTQARYRRGFVKKMHSYMAIFLTDVPLMEREIWCFEYFHLSVQRRCGAAGNCTIRFDDVPDERNRSLLKLYIKKILEQTDLSLSTILARLYSLKVFFRWWGKRPIDSFSQQDLEDYASSFARERYKNRNAAMNILRDFFLKGVTFGVCLSKPLWYDSIKKFRYSMRQRMVPSLVVKALFARLDKLPRVVAAMLLLIYYSGIRISEAVHMRVEAVQRFSAEETKYIQVYQFKMRKYVITPIPNHLYELLLQQREEVLRQNPKERYLFPQVPGVPYRTSYLGQYMNRFCRRENICDEHGTIYRFRMHDFRHSYAMRLIRNDVPFLTVQHLLHHNTPEMTLVYAQLDEETRKQRYLQFCAKNEAMRKEMSLGERAIDDDMIWLHHQISQVLPHGYCGYPIKLGACPHANACLFCDKFSTTKEFLPVLRYQLAKIRHLQRYLKDEEGIRQLKRIECRLLEIIREVEGSHDDTASAKASMYR